MVSLEELKSIYIKYEKEQVFNQKPHNLYNPINYIMALEGKKIRPLLVLLGYKIFDSELSKPLPAAFGIELFHNFTLVHDDIMDQAITRRGGLTVHVKYNKNIAILSGDVMQIIAIKYMYKCQIHNNDMDLVGLFLEVAQGVCDGQQHDMDFEKEKQVSIGSYLNMIRLKTAILLGAAIKIGAIIGGASEEEQDLLYEFAINLGMAFQMQDDYLDTFGNQKSFGKKIGGDIINSKKTFLVIKTLELANKQDERALWVLLRNENNICDIEKIKAVKALFLKYGIPQKILYQKEQFERKAEEAILNIGLSKEKAQCFFDLLSFLKIRNN